MSANYQLKSMPPKWVSAHRKCEFKYRLPVSTISSGYDDGNGYLKINLSGAFAYALAVGDRVYIPAGTDYTGFHVIRTVHSTVQYTLETTYTTPISGSATIYEVVLPTVSLYKGYDDNELILPLYPSGSLDIYDIQPRELLAEFQPEAGADGFIQFDISGYLKAALESPYKVGYNETETDYIYAKSATQSYLPMNTAKIELIIEGNLERTLIAHNTSLAVGDLNRYYVDTVTGLQPLKQVPSFTQGVNSYDSIKQTNNTLIRTNL
jgi:hypothetical protein